MSKEAIIWKISIYIGGDTGNNQAIAFGLSDEHFF